MYRAGRVTRITEDQALLEGEPLLWVWSCGTQTCNDNFRRGRINLTFSNGAWMTSDDAENEEGWWPPRPGWYRTVLIQFIEGEEEPDQYVAKAVSEVFRIDEMCRDNDGVTNNDNTEESNGSEQGNTNNGETETDDGDDDDDDDNDGVTVEEEEDDRDDDGGNTATDDNATEEEEEEEEEIDMTPPPSGMAEVIQNARRDITNLISARGSLSALYLRMVFHDCVSGGCDGCINTLNPENGGLNGAMNSLTELVTQYRPQGLSRADLYVLASYVGVDMTLPGRDNTTLNVPMMIPFTKYGRQDCVDPNPRRGPDPELCSPNLGTDEIVDFFHEHFDFTAQETAAIMGAHTVGILRRNILGFHGPNGWVPDNTRFDNQYYEELVGTGQSLERQLEGTKPIFIHRCKKFSGSWSQSIIYFSRRSPMAASCSKQH